MTTAWRSLLFSPATDEARLAKAHTRGADALILDLEDALPADAKVAGRAAAQVWIERLAGLGQDVVVRINTPWLMAVADLDAVVRPGLKALLVPKAEDAGQLSVIAAMVGELEAERGLPAGGIGLLALIETPAAFSRLAEIAAVERVVGLALGPEDLSLSLGAPPSPLTLDLPCRLIALAAANRGLMALGAPISIAEFRDLEAYRGAVETARGMGLSGNLCVHPHQVEVVNAVFAPQAAEVADARAVLAAWQAGEGKGVVALEGRMIDLPVVERARRVLARAGET